MTSGATQAETLKFFADNSYFGLNPANVFLFEQDLIPCLTADGKARNRSVMTMAHIAQLILDEPHVLSRSPNGNGGLYSSVCCDFYAGWGFIL